MTEQTHDGVRVAEIRLAFPPDGTPSGGELHYMRCRNGVDVGEVVAIALEPGEPDGIKSLDVWCRGMLYSRKLIPDGATVMPVHEKPKAEMPAAEPGVTLG